MKKKAFIIIIIILMLTCNVLCGCLSSIFNDYTIENGFMAFVYEKRGIAELVGITDEYMQKEELVLPTTIAGCYVRDIRTSIVGTYRQDFFDDKGNRKWLANKIFIPGNNYRFNKKNATNRFPVAEKRIFLSVEYADYSDGFYHKDSEYDEKIEDRYPYYQGKFYVAREHIEDFQKAYSEDNPNAEFIANNVYFNYNYNYSPNAGYYWMDNIEEGANLKTLPEDPTRFGYEFYGWYDNPECEGRMIKLAEIVKGEEDLHLYAKWYRL